MTRCTAAVLLCLGTCVYLTCADVAPPSRSPAPQPSSQPWSAAVVHAMDHIDATSMQLLRKVDTKVLETLAACHARTTASTRAMIRHYYIEPLLEVITEHIGTNDQQRILAHTRQQANTTELDTESDKELAMALIPTKCVLHDRHDLYHAFKSQYSADHSSGYDCCMCGKSFLSLSMLDSHMKRRHSDRIMQGFSDNLTCLADYCGVFRCDDHLERDAHCFPHTMANLQTQCYALLASCSPHVNMSMISDPAFNLTKFNADITTVVSTVCSRLACDYTPPRFSDSVWTVFAGIFVSIFLCLFCLFYYRAFLSKLFPRRDPLAPKTGLRALWSRVMHPRKVKGY